MHLQGGVLVEGLPGGSRRAGGNVGAAAIGQARQAGGITGPKAQRQRGGQSQRRQAADGPPPEGHFFFFPVFHDVFSFC